MIYGLFVLAAGTIAVSAIAMSIGIVICYAMDSYVDAPREQDDE